LVLSNCGKSKITRVGQAIQLRSRTGETGTGDVRLRAGNVHKLKRVLYIGQFQPGTTSYARGCCVKGLLPEAQFISIDTLNPLYETPRLFRSVGFRWKTGPLIGRVNDYVLERVGKDPYDLIWVDKAVYLTESTTHFLRKKSRKLIHFTPDPAFYYHRSRHVENSLPYYDTVATTKSFEIEDYASHVDRNRLVLVTQGYDPTQHYPRKTFDNRIPGVCFIGHHEKVRQEIIESILREEIRVFVAGRGWEKFYRRNSKNPKLIYGGKGIYGDAYAETLSDYQVGLGLLSEWIPEKHTTRTFEIPACGAILATPHNNETSAYFTESEVLFFDSASNLIAQLKVLLGDPEKARTMANNGHERILGGRYDYRNIVASVLKFPQPMERHQSL